MPLKRLLSDRPTPLERMLLEASVRERPSDAQRARVREAMLQAAPAAKPASTSGALATKAIFAGVLGTALVGLVLVRRPHRADDAASNALEMPALMQQAQSSLPTQPAAIEPPAADTTVARSEAPQPVRPAMVTAKARTTENARTARAPAGDGSDVREQIRIIDEARAAMDHHNASGALIAVERYMGRYPDGIFGQEARILRILALDERGDHARAAVLARAFLATYPTSAHVARIEHIAQR
jgi:hypothetical protein